MTELQPTTDPVQATPRRRWPRSLRAFVVLSVITVLAILLLPGRPPTETERLLAELDARSPETWIEGWLREVGFRRYGHNVRPETIIRTIVQRDGERAIPFLIGVIDADNSTASLYDVGHHGLGELTGVEFSFFHDGAWWRRWWARNRERYPDDVRDIPIPDLPKTRSGRKWKPFPEDIDTLKGKLRIAPELLAEWRLARKGGSFPRVPAVPYVMDVARHRDPHAIPYLIALLGVGGQDELQMANKLKTMIGIQGEVGRTQDWWRMWWADHRREYAEDVAAIDVPELTVPWPLDWTETPDVLPDSFPRRQTKAPGAKPEP